jgi:plasmid maintenance system antidote protein VapI
MKALLAEYPTDVLEVIRKELAEQGKTHRALADHLGITEKHLSMMMRNKARMHVPMLFRILDYLGLYMLFAAKKDADALPET